MAIWWFPDMMLFEHENAKQTNFQKNWISLLPKLDLLDKNKCKRKIRHETRNETRHENRNETRRETSNDFAIWGFNDLLNKNKYIRKKTRK